MKTEFKDDYQWDVASLRAIIFEKNKNIYTLLEQLYKKNKENSSWEIAASDLALKVIKLEQKIKELENTNKIGWEYKFPNNSI